MQRAERYVSAGLGRSQAEGTLIIDVGFISFFTFPRLNYASPGRLNPKKGHVGVKMTTRQAAPFSLTYHSIRMLNPT